jgi:hypothetical protein
MFAFYEENVRAGVQYSTCWQTAGSKFLRTARKCRIETVDGNSSENEKAQVKGSYGGQGWGYG